MIMPSTTQAAPRGKLYIIGMGPAGPDTATLQALRTLAKMDAVMASALVQSLFPEQLKGKRILFDPVKGLWDYKGRFFTSLKPTEMPAYKKERTRLTKQRLAQIESLLAQGKNLGLLEGGNPMVFASCHWYTERMNPKDLVFIPGMGSAAAAMAALGRSVIPAHQTRLLMQTAPFVITDEKHPNAADFKGLGPYKPTMIFYMAFKKNPRPFFSALAQAFSPQTPCAAVFNAGYPDKQLVVRGTLQDMPERLIKLKAGAWGCSLWGTSWPASPTWPLRRINSPRAGAAGAA